MVLSGRYFSAGLLVLLACFTLAGCKGQEQEPVAQPRAALQGDPLVKQAPRVEIPDEVAGEWKAVKVTVFNKDSGDEEIYTVDIGSRFRVGESDISLEIVHFLPNFIMDGTVMTSASNEPNNPAAQIVIREGEEVIFKGWLFSLYPNTHAFQHPRYSFTLVDFIRA